MASNRWCIIDCREMINDTVFDNGFSKIFKVAIITLSVCFVGITRHCIILHYLAP